MAMCQASSAPCLWTPLATATHSGSRLQSSLVWPLADLQRSLRQLVQRYLRSPVNTVQVCCEVPAESPDLLIHHGIPATLWESTAVAPRLSP